MKNKIKIILYTLSILLLSFTNAYSSEIKIDNPPEMRDSRFACKTYFEKLSKSDDNSVRDIYSSHSFDDYGFYIEQIYDFKKNKWVAKKDINNNLKIGQIYNNETASKINSGDPIISINGNKITNEEEFKKIGEDKDINELKIILLDKNNKNNKYEVKLIKSYNDYTAVEYIIKNFDISEIDIKKNTYDLTIRQAFTYRFNQDFDENKVEKNHEILNLAIGTLIYYNYDQERHMYHVCYISENVFDEGTILDPSHGMIIGNILENDKDLERTSSKAIPYHTFIRNTYNEILISKEKFNVYKIKNDFNLKSFPFDKQFIKFQIIDDAYQLDTRIIHNTKFTYLALDKFMSLDDIPGWNKKSYTTKNQPYQTATQYKDTYKDSYVVTIELERKAGYYIFKVIFPILLILLICWSVFWVDPKELESRLTITIVCLLSLIAYNFVIDSELPKLEYLTVLDWVILISYVYATVPNLLSVLSFRLLKTNLSLGNKIEQVSKRYGLASYILIIFFIVLLNANMNFEHSSSMLSWMVPR